MVSEISLGPEAEDLENSSLPGDMSEADGSESDSSSYSGVSTRGVHGLLVNSEGTREASSGPVPFHHGCPPVRCS